MRKIDLTGQKFNLLTVLGDDPNCPNNIICQCECGTIKSFCKANVKFGKTKSCGCLRAKATIERNKNNARNIIGNRYGKLIVLNTEEDNNNHRVAICQCDCGNIVKIRPQSLYDGHTKSCGCLIHEQYFDLTNQKYGKLTVIGKTDSRTSDNKILWKCKCECGNFINTTYDHLKYGYTQSCGCVKSRGENRIKQLLIENNIPFEQQKKFQSCKYPDTNYLAIFDFYVNNEYLIEFDGEQHFKPIKNWGGEEYFKKIQEHDAIKNQWCKNNNIPLIRIPYNALKDLKIEYLLLSKNNPMIYIKSSQKEELEENEYTN